MLDYANFMNVSRSKYLSKLYPQNILQELHAINWHGKDHHITVLSKRNLIKKFVHCVKTHTVIVFCSIYCYVDISEGGGLDY